MKRKLGDICRGVRVLFFCLSGLVFAALLAASASAQTCDPPPSGILSWWSGEGNALDQVSGNNGIWYGTTSYATGKVGQAFNLNGQSFIRIPDAPNLHFTNAMTAEAWVNPSYYNYSSAILVKYTSAGSDDTGACFSFSLDGNGHPYLEFDTNASIYSSVTVSATGAVPLNQWTYLAATFDGTALKMYVNGVLSATVPYGGTIYPGTTDLGIGACLGGVPYGQGTGIFQGLIDEPALYNRALSASEIAAIYNAGAAGKCTDTFPPAITAQPQSATVYAGSNVTFTVGTSGSIPMSFQWRLNNGDIASATNSSLTISSAQSSDAGSYSVFVSNAAGSATSSNAVLTVLPSYAPCITNQPQSLTLAQGSNANFSVGANGTQPLYYQWLFKGSPLVGATASSLAIADVQDINEGNYAVVVSNFVGVAISSNATLTVINGVCDPAPSNVVSWWSADGNALDQVSGNNGVWYGTTRYANGKVGQAFSLDGGSFVRIPDAPNLHFTTAMTAEAWINPSSFNYANSILVKYPSAGSDGTGSCFSFSLNGNGQPYLTINTNASLYGSIAVTASNAVPLNQWTHLAGTYDGTALKMYVNGVLSATVPIVGSIYPGTTDLGIGACLGGVPYGQGTGIFSGLIDEPALYNRALSDMEIATIYRVGAGGKCPGIYAPSITSQPQDATVGSGSNVTFTVGAGGSIPLSYQWSENNNAISGATNGSLTVSNVSMALNGAVFSVTVNNQAGSVVSSNAVLNVLPAPSLLLIQNQTATSGVVVVPVVLVAQGNENTIGFSLNFDTNILTFGGAQLDADDTNATMFANTNGASSGHVGLAISQQTGDAFEAGTNIVADVTFIVVPRTNAVTTQLTFGDTPIQRQVYDANADSLAAVYTNGTLTIPYLGFEGDVYPLQVGDGKVLLNDWVEMGRIVAGLDVISNAAEFQRADCAPRSTLGDGQITVCDWIQIGRYAAGLDAARVAGGPTQPAGGGNSFVSKKSSGSTGGSTPSPYVVGRSLSVTSAGVLAGQNCQLSVILAAQGGESGVEFSVNFPSNVLSYVSASLGSGASGASLVLNTKQAALGRLGVVLALPIGSSFSAGNLEVLKLTLKSAAISAGGNSITFNTQPLPNQVSDSTANSVSSAYVPGTITITPIARPALALNGKSSGLSFTYPASATGFILQSTSSLNPPNWTNAVATVATNGSNIVVTGATNNPHIFYRLRSP